MTRYIVEVKITGYLVGPIWWPPGQRGSKSLVYTLNRGHPPLYKNLVDILGQLTTDGDFQYCQIADGWLSMTFTRDHSNGVRRIHTRTNSWPLSHFPSIADYLTTDWE